MPTIQGSGLKQCARAEIIAAFENKADMLSTAGCGLQAGYTLRVQARKQSSRLNSKPLKIRSLRKSCRVVAKVAGNDQVRARVTEVALDIHVRTHLTHTVPS